MEPSTRDPKFLRRYTSLPSLLHVLQNKQMTFLNPATWDDRNDAYFMEQYKQRKKFKTALALCFSETGETYHHWRVFTRGSEGVCIHFHNLQLMRTLKRIGEIRSGQVKYKPIDDLERTHPAADKLPFLKRLPYEHEFEFRILYVSKTKEYETKGIDIDLSCIERVVLNPWMPKPLANSVKATIKSIPGCAHLSVYRTTLLENERWMNCAMQMAKT